MFGYERKFYVLQPSGGSGTDVKFSLFQDRDYPIDFAANTFETDIGNFFKFHRDKNLMFFARFSFFNLGFFRNCF